MMSFLERDPEKARRGAMRRFVRSLYRFDKLMRHHRVLEARQAKLEGRRDAMKVKIDHLRQPSSSRYGDGGVAAATGAATTVAMMSDCGGDSSCS
jgi:hypothetical protein